MMKNPTQKIIKQIAQEPLEILKTAGSQIAAEQVSQQEQSVEGQVKPKDQQDELRDKAKSTRRMEAYQRELNDIKREKLFKELQRRIAQGEEIPLEDYLGLTPEQRQVLKAQMEAVKMQMTNSQKPNDQLVEPAAKKGRRLFDFGKKQEVKRQQTRVENIVPPSG